MRRSAFVPLVALFALGAGVDAPPLPSLRIDQLPAGVRDRVTTAVGRAQEHPRSAGEGVPWPDERR